MTRAQETTDKLLSLGLGELEVALFFMALDYAVKGDLQRRGVGFETGFRSRSNIYWRCAEGISGVLLAHVCRRGSRAAWKR